MPALAGKGILVRVSTDDITYNTVAGINDASASIEGDNQDITAFSENYISRLQGLKDTSYSLSGYFDVADTTGQLVIRNALVTNTTLYFRFLYNGTNGYKQQVKVSSFEVSASVDGISELSIELEGTDTITIV
jgi:predicted secreted protein